ncbi:hypothetical protein ACHAPC_000788 [Botrytis cinerea]|uniref:Uncharacterized protein n=1 Tax=Botryotinia fuckeliana (strain T4) TaxID=999810 RepID=G2XR70_BOTF4|nr:hypothetical protein BofuT4_P013470.1 [Botrytis cinerea T4]
MCKFGLIICSAKDAHWMKLDAIYLCAQAQSTFAPCSIYSAKEEHLQKLKHWLYPAPCRKCHPNIEQDVKEAMSTPIGTVSDGQEAISQSPTTANNLSHDKHKEIDFESSNSSDKPFDMRGDHDGMDDGSGC